MAGNRDHTPDYTYIRPLSKEEREVQALGYSWVTTNHLDR
jgi:hypothetical protein